MRFPSSRATPLIDDEVWTPLVRSIRDARSEILLTQLLFDPDFAPLGMNLCDALEAAAKRGVRIVIVLNENAVIPDTVDEMMERFEGTTVDVMRLPMSPNVLHAKIVVVDGKDAYLIDPPFENRYVDHRTHPSLGSAQREQPLHSVSVRLAGPAAAGARDIAATIIRAAGATPPPRPAEPRAAGSLEVDLVCSFPPRIFGPEATLDILAAYEGAIGRAKRFIYIENQYFTSPRIRDALLRALEREPTLEVIMLLNRHVDVPGYDAWQLERLDEMGAFEHPRLGVFAHRTAYLHSKVAIVDDAWVTLGSANLDSVSLHTSEEFPAPVPPNIEANAQLRDPDLCVGLRRRLWGEHLDDEGIWQEGAPEGGWLAHWRRIADRNAALVAGGDERSAGKVIPFPFADAPARKRQASITR